LNKAKHRDFTLTSCVCLKQQHWLVGGLEHFLLFQLTFIFFRGVETTNQKSVGLPTENGTSPAMNWEPAAHVDFIRNGWWFHPW